MALYPLEIMLGCGAFYVITNKSKAWKVCFERVINSLPVNIRLFFLSFLLVFSFMKQRQEAMSSSDHRNPSVQRCALLCGQLT